MLEMKNAYEILGLKEGASRDEIDKRYSILLKKYRNNSAGESNDVSPQITINEITRAYNVLMGYETQEPVMEATKTNELFKKLGVDEKKTKNFFYYYKYHMIIGIILLIVLVTTIRGCVNRVPSDLNMAFLGNFYYSDQDVLKENILKNMPGLKAIEVDSALMSDDTKGEQAYAMTMKATVLLAAADIDIFILDEKYFEMYASEGAFIALDGLSNTINIDKNKGMVVESKEEQKEHVYGFDISNSTILNESNILGDKKIAAISVKAKHYDNAVKLLEQLAK